MAQAPAGADVSSSVSSLLATDFTHILDRRPARRLLALAAAVVAALGCSGALARADGDPASDVLLNYSYFLPWDAGTAAVAQQGQLAGVLQAAARAGFPIRVAIIAYKDDLGSVTPLWGDPVAYARFLGEELSFVYRGQLLVVMPDGLGLFSSGTLPAAERAAIGSMSAPGASRRLPAAAVAAVRGLSAAAGYPLSRSLIAAASPRAAPASDELPSRLAFAAGAALVGLAWAASLRARPLHLRRDTIPTAP